MFGHPPTGLLEELLFAELLEDFALELEDFAELEDLALELEDIAELEDCIGFTLEYQIIAENTSAKALVMGPRTLWVSDGENWTFEVSKAR